IATAAKKYSIPCVAINGIMTITVAPAPPEIMLGLPPNIEVINPIRNAPYNPVSGGKPATIANDNDSGIIVIATVNPAKISTRYVFICSSIFYLKIKYKVKINELVLYNKKNPNISVRIL